MTMDWPGFPKATKPRGGVRLAIPLALVTATAAFSAKPTTSNFLPPDGSTRIAGRQPFQIQFASPMQAGTGNIVFRRSSDNSIFESIPVPSDRVSFGSSLLLKGFDSGVEEWNLWGEAIRTQDNSRARTGTGSLKAVTSSTWDQVEGRFASQNWSGFDSLACWVYTETSGATAHAFTRSGTTDDWTDGTVFPGPALTPNAWTRISIPISVITDPTRVNSYGLNFSIAGTYWVDDVALVGSNSNIVSFLPSNAFALGTGYHVNIDAGAFKDLSNEDYAGISDATSWNFTTNFQPTGMTLGSSTVAENLASRSFVAKISATDPDAGETFLFRFAAGTGSTDNASFAISNDSLFTNAVFDFEAKSSYSIRLSVEDRRAGYYAKEFAISIANASDRLTWDNASTPGIQPGSGTWGTDNFWSYNGTDLFAWPGTGHAALFAGADGGYSITVNGTQSADSVIFANSGYTISSGTIAMTGSAPTIVASADATISSSISGAFAKAGTATLTLSGSNSAAQPYTHLAGTVVAASSTSLGAGPVNMNGTGRIVLNNGVNLVNTLTITSCDPEMGRGVLESNANANATWSGALNVNANCATGGTIAGSTDMTGSLTITGPINMGGTATVVKQRAGLVVYRGGGNATRFDLQRGTARLGINNGLPPNAALIQSESNTDYQVIVDLNGYNQQFSSLYSLVGTSRSVTNSSGTPSTLTLTGSSDTTYLGNITGKLSLEKTGTGRQTLKGTNNTYSGGTAIRTGTLVIDGSLTSTTPVDVVTGGKLFCNGNIPGYLNVNEESVQPGTPFAIGALTGTGANFSNGTGSSLGIRVKGTTKPGIDYDRLTLSGNLVLGGASILNLDLSGLTETGTSTGIVQANGISGTFASVNLLNNPGKATVTVVYKSSSIDVVILNSPPSFVKGADQTGLEDAGLRTVPGWATAISKGSPAESAQVLGFRVSNDNNALFSAQPAISPEGTLTYTPADDANGSATVSVRLGDDGGTANGSVDSSAIQTFSITVTPVNDAPGFAKGSDQSTLQNSSSRTIENWATSISRGPADESGQNMGFRVSNDNNTLFSTQPAISATGTLTYTPAAGAVGTATVLVRLGDDGGTANGGVDSSSVDTFRIVVTPVNQPPSFTKGADQTALEDAGLRTVPGWATAISKGSPLESSQNVGFRVSNDNNALFSGQPAISPEGTLTYTPADDANGSATVSVRLGDDGGTANGSVDSSAIQTFSITVTPVNDAPGFAKGSDQSTLQNSSSRTIENWATSISRGPADESGQNMGFRVSNDNNTLFSTQPAISATGTLTYTPAAGAVGTATVLVRLGDDGGTANGGTDSSAEASFTIRILPPLSFAIRPDTLRMRSGDTASFSVAAKSGSGQDTTVAMDDLSWSWTRDLGILEAGRVTSRESGSSMVVALGSGTGDSAWLIVSPLDTLLAPGTDSVVIRVGHGVVATIPPSTTPRRVAVVVVDSTLGGGIAGADTAVMLVGGTVGSDSIRLELPSALVPAPVRTLHGTPSVYWKDSAGIIHESPARLLSNSSLSIHALDGRTYWLGYDTLAPAVSSTFSGDSVRTGQSIRIDWRLFDNVAETGSHLCLLKAGNATAVCSLLVRGDSIHGTLQLAKAHLPLGGRVWMEGRDARSTVRGGARDIVVQLDTLRATAPRSEDRYELVALPYTSGAGSAHASFRSQWGPDNPKRWRAYSIDTTDFVEILEGSPRDARGRGFWVRTRKADLVQWISGGWTPPVTDPVRIDLDPGWNLVGNPLGFDVSWRQVRRLSGLDTLAISGPYRFRGSEQDWTIPDTTMSWPAWQGVAVHNSTGRPLRLLVPSIPSGEFAPRNADQASRMRFSVRASQAADTTARIWGGFDASGASPLPPSPVALRVFLPAPSGSGSTLPFLADVRPYSDTGSTWTIHVDGLRPQVPLALDLARSGTDTAIPLWVRDDKSGRWLPFASRMDFAVGDEPRRDFQILAGAAPANRDIPRRFGLRNLGRDLGWSLPDEMGRVRVKIDVFDLRGRKLAGLVDEEMDPGTYVRGFALSAPTTQVVVVLSAGGRRGILRRLWMR
ncbi:MAG TPA: Ig-like domain-containing protein [Fibrobacteria bacterium]|nr:Ig-like domain-containing protein [Fibrobacteria bacterium]